MILGEARCADAVDAAIEARNKLEAEALKLLADVEKGARTWGPVREALLLAVPTVRIPPWWPPTAPSVRLALHGAFIATWKETHAPVTSAAQAGVDDATLNHLNRQAWGQLHGLYVAWAEKVRAFADAGDQPS